MIRSLLPPSLPSRACHRVLVRQPGHHRQSKPWITLCRSVGVVVGQTASSEKGAAAGRAESVVALGLGPVVGGPHRQRRPTPSTAGVCLPSPASTPLNRPASSPFAHVGSTVVPSHLPVTTPKRNAAISLVVRPTGSAVPIRLEPTLPDLILPTTTAAPIVPLSDDNVLALSPSDIQRATRHASSPTATLLWVDANVRTPAARVIRTGDLSCCHVHVA